MQRSSRILEADARIQALAPGLKSDDPEERIRTWRAINAWLDNRLVAMEEDPGGVVDSVSVTP